MSKPYRFRNLISLFIFLVMILSGMLVVTCFLLLRAVRILSPGFFATVWMPIVLILAVNLIATIANFFLVPRVIRPIEALIDATGRVAKGDFKVQLPSDQLVGEIKELTESFNAMTRELGNTEIFRSDFIRDFSHEFKTPIVSMRGFAKELKNPDLTVEEREQFCDIIIAESERLANMSGNVLLLSRFENQEIISDKQFFSLDEQIRNCVILLETEWEKKDLDMVLELAPIEMEQNAEMLCHVWTNLLSNAIKFTPTGGRISVCAEENQNTVLVSVRDTGIGMTREEQKHIFDKCYQADPSHSTGGNGLGLCIVKRVVELCGGEITVRSEKEKGSAFTVALPKGPKRSH